MRIQELIFEELKSRKSVAALAYIISKGGEVRIESEGDSFLVSCSGSHGFVSLWNDGCEIQSFNDEEDFLENAKLNGVPFLIAWLLTDARVEVLQE